MSKETQNQKDLRIKFASVRRTEKEIKSYVKEADKQKQKIEKLIAEKAEEAYVNKQKQVLDETETMIPDCQTRYDNMLEELEMFVEDFGMEDDIKDTEQLKEVQEYLTSAKA